MRLTSSTAAASAESMHKVPNMGLRAQRHIGDLKTAGVTDLLLQVLELVNWSGRMIRCSLPPSLLLDKISYQAH